jgi:hypothetical protein
MNYPFELNKGGINVHGKAIFTTSFETDDRWGDADEESPVIIQMFDLIYVQSPHDGHYTWWVLE